MKVKYILLFLLLIFVSGCSATYNLEIKDDDFKESIDIKLNSKDDVTYFKDNTFYAIMDGARNFQPYDSKMKEKDNFYLLNYKYKYSIKEFKSATILKSCFDAYNVIKEDDYYVISTSEGLKCAKSEGKKLLDNLKIVIKTNHKVIETNGKKENGYTYSWQFNENNFDNENIYIKFYQDKYVFNYNNEFIKTMIIVASLIVITATSIIYAIFKVRKAQRI